MLLCDDDGNFGDEGVLIKLCDDEVSGDIKVSFTQG